MQSTGDQPTFTRGFASPQDAVKAAEELVRSPTRGVDRRFKPLVWVMRLHYLSSDADRIRSQLMKNFSRVVLGSVAGSLLGAASFFAIDGLITRTSKAHQ